MNLTRTLVPACLALGAVTSALPSVAVAADDPPGVEALELFRNGRPRQDSVQNRFFLKQKRFELAPMFGLVPSNPFVSRFTVGLNFGYHFNEQLAITGIFAFAPDRGSNDIKGLTATLLDLAPEGTDFEQPLDKVTLSSAFGVSFAPLYGKINLLGETVLSFDFYGFLGMGFVVQTEYRASKNPDATTLQEFVVLERGATELRPAPTLAFGGNFFFTQTVGLKIDARFMFYPDDKPVYDLNAPPTGLRLVTEFTASVGVTFFVPKMKPRLYDF
jgi:outer membrane beta-barrel protein